MFERNYHYLVAGLPDIILDQKKLSLSIAEFRDDLNIHLHPDDYRLVELLFLPADNYNLLNLISKSSEPFDESGKYTREQLEEEIREPSSLPGYMQNFINAYKSESPLFEGLSWEDQLTWLYYDYLKECSNKFLRDWFEFDLNLKNIIAGFNVRKFKLKGEKYYIGNNHVVQSVRKSTLKDFGLSIEFEHMDKLVSIYENDNLQERERATDNLRWEFMDERNTFNYFTIEVLLAYIIKLQMVQRWLEMDYETGVAMFKKILDQLEQSYEFPKEFLINESRARKL